MPVQKKSGNLSYPPRTYEIESSRKKPNLFKKTRKTKGKIDNRQQNSKWRFGGERYESINLITSKRSKQAQKEFKTGLVLVGKVDPLWIVQEIVIWPYYQIVHAQTRIFPKEWDS